MNTEKQRAYVKNRIFIQKVDCAFEHQNFFLIMFLKKQSDWNK